MKKIHHLEGIRGLGALAVYTCHFQLVFFPYIYFSIGNFLRRFLSPGIAEYLVSLLNLHWYGILSIHIFWALSGYVIFMKFFNSDHVSESLTAATIRRYFRLMLPCGFSVMFGYALYQAGLVYIRDVQAVIMNVEFFNFPPSFWQAFKVATWSSYFDFDFVNTYNGPLWTIEKEMFGSLAGFALMGLSRRHKQRGWLYLAFLLYTFFMHYYWMTSFLLGYILCDIDFSPEEHKPFSKKIIQKVNNFLEKNGTIGILLFFVFFFCGRGLLLYYSKQFDLNNSRELQLISCVLGFLLIFILLRVKSAAKFMEWKPIIATGKISLGLYAMHWPVMYSLTCWLYVHYQLYSNLQRLLLYIGTTALTLAVSWLFSKYIDVPSIRFSTALSRKLDGLPTTTNK
jgi:peptidoglycan/LPS O-acetylase OafA/YrhL